MATQTEIEGREKVFDLVEFESNVNKTKMKIANAESVSDIKSQLCQVWSKIEFFVRLGQKLPGKIGAGIGIFADLMDSLCS